MNYIWLIVANSLSLGGVLFVAAEKYEVSKLPLFQPKNLSLQISCNELMNYEKAFFALDIWIGDRSRGEKFLPFIAR